MAQTTVAPSMTQGYALCSPLGVLLGHSYRKTEAEAIASVYENPGYRDQFWAEATAEGWTVQFVYARIFTPAYFAAQTLPEDVREDAA